jgi:hypothetical protein
LPPGISELLAARGLEGSVRLAFEEPPPSGAEMVSRCHQFAAASCAMDGIISIFGRSAPKSIIVLSRPFVTRPKNFSAHIKY